MKKTEMEQAESEKKATKGMPRALKYFLAALLLVVLFLVGFVPKLLNNRRLNAQATATKSALPIVEVARPRLAAPDSVVLPGNVEAIRETSTQSRTTGYVAKLYVDIGSHVKAGQILADVESPDVDQQLAQAQAQTSQSQATVAQSLANVESLQATVMGSEAEVHHQEAAFIQAKAALAGAISAKSQAESNLLAARARVTQSMKQVEAQRQALSQAQTNYNLAAANKKRYSALLEGGYVAQQDYDQALTTLKNDVAGIASAKANFQSAEADELANEATVRANMQAVQSAQSAEDSAVANIKAARSIVESSTQSLAAARSNLNAGRQVVQANVMAVQSNAANARRYGVLQSFEHVVAPFDGIITARNVDVGSLVSPGATSSADATNTTPTTGLFGIARTDTLRIYVSLPQPDFRWAPRGRKVKVTIRELGQRAFTGTVFQTSGALDSTTRTLQTEVRIPNASGVLLPGMYAEVEFPAGSEREIRVPSGAILVDADGTKVVVLDATNHIHYRKVILGRDYGAEAEVQSGITAQDRLAGNASDDWTDGQQVQAVEPKPAAGGSPATNAPGTGTSSAPAAGSPAEGAQGAGKT